ncbi:MAG: hypothetical protein ACR2MU_09290, partial [Gaiellaceae bacterium]
DPAVNVPRFDRFTASVQGFVQDNCHVMMHWVGRKWAAEHHMTLTRLQDVLPRSNSPFCSAGFGHGILTYLGPQVVKLGPKGALADCEKEGTRYQRYSCVHGLGHAYMRTYSELLPYALRACTALGPRASPDCAQGAFHDYWLSLQGLDDTQPPAAAQRSVRKLCGRQQSRFVRVCWYRAIQENPPPDGVSGRAGILRTCAGLTGLQRAGCITGATVVSSPDPFVQARTCATLADRDRVDCVRAVATPNLAGKPLAEQLRLVGVCARFGAERGGCVTWLGKSLAVVTDGRFGSDGCPRLASGADCAACKDGAARMNDALETFS